MLHSLCTTGVGNLPPVVHVWHTQTSYASRNMIWKSADARKAKIFCYVERCCE